jgi:RND superfamily putative drug exporter
VSIPGTATAKVQDELVKKFPKVSGGSGTVVFSTKDGSQFTATQEQQIDSLLGRIGQLKGIRTTVSPFQTQAKLDKQHTQLSDAEAQISDGEKQLDAGQQQLDAAKQQLATGRQQLADATAQAQASGTLAQAQSTLDAQQAQLDASQQQLDAQQKTITQNRATLADKSADVKRGSTLLAMSSNIRMVSSDGSAAVGTVQFRDATLSVPQPVKTSVLNALDDAKIDGVAIDASDDIAQGIPSVAGPGEAVGLLIAAIALFVMLGTLVAASLPIIGALVGVAVGALGVLSFSGVVEMTSVTPVLGLMLGLAVGIDYALFILNRHRKQLRQGVELHESIGLATGTSGTAVVFAGSTVLVALLALNVTGIPFLGLMGIAGAVCVAIAVLVAITLIPALLSLIGMRLLRRRERATVGEVQHDPKLPMKAMSTTRAVVTLVAGIAALVIVALPALTMRLGLPDGSSEAVNSSQYKAFSIVEDKFGAGANGPLLVTASLPEATTGTALTDTEIRIGQKLLAQDDVSAVAPIGASSDNTMIAFQVLPKGGPSSESTETLVKDIRGLSPLSGDVTLGVAGSASGNIDISEKLADALPLYLAVVLGLSLIIMIVVFRSILVPVTATAGFVLSLFAAFGGLTAIYQWGWLGQVFGVHDPGPVLSFLPTIELGILFGLAMDYQLFLVTGMRESFVHGTPARLAVRRGVHAGRTVVIAAAIIMISVFSGFIFSDASTVRPIGFGLAFGVLVDAFVVRMLLIPAAMHLAGKSAWWLPKWLDRILPNVDVEGASLKRTHPIAPPAPADPREDELVSAQRG